MSDRGAQAAIDAAGGIGTPPEPETAEQLNLLPDMRAGDELPDGEGGDQVPAQRSPGRPKGARNKRTTEMLDYIGGQYGLPAVRLAQLYSADPQVLASRYSLKLKEALELQKSAAIALLPYMHQKQPLAIDLEKKSTVTLVFNDAPDPDQINDDDGFSITIDGEAIAALSDEGENETP